LTPPAYLKTAKHFRAGWLAGVEYCLDRIRDGVPLELVERDARAVAEAGGQNFQRGPVRSRASNEKPGGHE
jgi:hypothetical protein